jgi:hypothetical protein
MPRIHWSTKALNDSRTLRLVLHGAQKQQRVLLRQPSGQANSLAVLVLQFGSLRFSSPLQPAIDSATGLRYVTRDRVPVANHGIADTSKHDFVPLRSTPKQPPCAFRSRKTNACCGYEGGPREARYQVIPCEQNR